MKAYRILFYQGLIRTPVPGERETVYKTGKEMIRNER